MNTKLNIYSFADALDQARLSYRLERTRRDSIRIVVTKVGERVEVDFFEDGHAEISKFTGDESVVGGEDDLLSVLIE